MENELVLLNQKVDRLTELLEAQARRQQAWEELKDDMIPIFNQFVKLMVDELAEIGMDFQLEDLLFLLKRLLRDTNLILTNLERLEAISDLLDEGALLSKQVFNRVVALLEQMEKDGYFAAAQSGLYVADCLIKEVSSEDIRSLGNNAVTVAAILRKVNQPSFLATLDKAAGALAEVPQERVSLWELLRGLFDPQFRRG